MARIRTIKPEFWRDEDLSKISAEAALLAIGLLNHADDEGFFSANTKLIEADVFPLRELSGSVTGMVEELRSIGYIKVFSGSDGKRYGQVVNFEKHQVINKKSPSKIKYLCDLEDDSCSPTVVLPTGKERKGKEEEQGSGKEPEPRKRSTPTVFELPDWINREHWDTWHSCAKRRKASAEQKALAVAKLETWRKAGQDFAGALENAAVGGYQGLFLPDAQKAGNSSNGKHAESFRVQDKKAAEQRWAAFTGNSRDVFDVTPEILELEHVDTNQSH